MTAARSPSLLATRRGKLLLALLCSIAFLDFVDASIVNLALPSIRRALHFSVAGLLWVPGGCLLTYGGLMLLGGRAADLVGRRRVLLSAEQTPRFAGLARAGRAVTVDGAAGFLVAPAGRIFAVAALTVRDDRIVEIDILADPERLDRIDLPGQTQLAISPVVAVLVGSAV